MRKKFVKAKRFCASYNQETCTGCNHEGSDTSEDFSDISDDSDIFHLCVDPAKTWITEQDRDENKIDQIAKLLRRNPFVPPDPEDETSTRDWLNVQSGVALPRAHCAFIGCNWVNDSKGDWEHHLKHHIKKAHMVEMDLEETDKNDFYDFCEAAIQRNAQEIMPSVGVSIDRRSLRYVTDTFNDDSVYSLICMVCAQSKTHTGLSATRFTDGWTRNLSDIQYYPGKKLLEWQQENFTHFDKNFGFRTFMQRYGQDWKVPGESDEKLREFGPNPWEWRRLLQNPRMKEPYEILCCPEDIECKQRHSPEQICRECNVPICKDCYTRLGRGDDVPMALANDNMWGYISPIIMKYKVRWIEMAAVLPYWTTMIVYYVESDRGHLMNEVLKENQHRTCVRGQAFSYIMPWDEIVKSMHQRVKSIPRDPECLKYMLRLHLKVAGKDFHQHLKQVHLRPGILVLLLKELFARKHEAFLGSHAAQCMERHLNDKGVPDFEKLVHDKYPEFEANIALSEREGSIPKELREEIEGLTQKMEEKNTKKRRVIHITKNATPGDAEQKLENCLDDVRPRSFTLDLKPSDCTTPDALKGGALERYGDLNVNVGNQLLSQWESQYFAKILPFVLPRMVSGPDFRPDDKWRRKTDSPVVTPQEWTRGMARRVEGQIRNDSTAISIIRSVCFKHTVEHASNLVVPYPGNRNRPSSVIATEMVKAAQGLYKVLWQGIRVKPW